MSKELFEVELIIGHTYIRSKKYYLVKWAHFSINESTWEPVAHLKHLQNLVQEYEKSVRIHVSN